MTQHNPTHFNHSHVHSVCGKGEGKERRRELSANRTVGAKEYFEREMDTDTQQEATNHR